MRRQQLNLSREKVLAVQIDGEEIILELENSSGAKMKMQLTLEDLEEISDLMVDSFYKAGIEARQSQVGKGVTMVRCGIFHPNSSSPYLDDDGCILEGVNHDWHVFIDAHTGRKIEWKDDPCSDCDCEGHYCTMYGPLEEKEAPRD